MSTHNRASSQNAERSNHQHDIHEYSVTQHLNVEHTDAEHTDAEHSDAVRAELLRNYAQTHPNLRLDNAQPIANKPPLWRRTWAFLHANKLPSCTLEALFALFFTTVLQPSTDLIGFLPFTANLNYVLVWTAVLCVPVATRKWKPDESAWAFAGLVILQCLFGPMLTMSDPLALVLLYDGLVLGRRENKSRFISAGLAIIALWGVLMVTGPLLPRNVRLLTNFNNWSLSASLSMSLMGVLLVVATIVAGLYRRMSIEQMELMREHNDMLARSQEESRTAARLAERARLARDMHDVVAHTLSIIIIQSDAGRYAGVTNPQVAVQTLRTIESETHEALAQMGEIFTTSSSPASDTVSAAATRQMSTQVLSKHELPTQVLAQQETATQVLAKQDAPTQVLSTQSLPKQALPKQAQTNPDAPTLPLPLQSAQTGETLAITKVMPQTAGVKAGAGSRRGPVLGGEYAGKSPVSTVPSYVGIENLVQEARNVSQRLYTVSYTVHGEPEPGMSERLQTVLYRTVQESLSNVRKYAVSTPSPAGNATAPTRGAVTSPAQPLTPVHVSIVETWGVESGIRVVDLLISDDGRGSKANEDGHRTGYGLIGMRERIRALGGTLAYGPNSQGNGFSLHAQIPTQPGIDLLALAQQHTHKADGAHSADRTHSAQEETQAGSSTSQTASGQANDPAHNPARHQAKNRADNLAQFFSKLWSNVIAGLSTLSQRLERFISWKARHPLINSLPMVLLLTVLVLYGYDAPTLHPHELHVLGLLCVPLMILPLLWRQRFPVIVGIWVACMSITFSVWSATHGFGFFFVAFPDLVAFSAALLYGEKKYRPLLISLCVPVVLADAFQEVMWSLNYRTHHQWDTAIWLTLIFYIVGDSVVAAIVGNLALLKRARGNDLALLHQKEQALLAARAKEAELAARHERERISAQMHEEIRETLHAVLDACASSAPQLEALAARYPDGTCTVTEQDQALISSLFAQLAQIGRKALADMRALLDILRRNEAAEQRSTSAPLRPLDGTH